MADDPYTGDPLDVYRKPDKQFSEETVGIASTLLEKKVTLGRPPSATMRNRKAAILNELSSAKSTSKHKAFHVPSPPAVRKDTTKPNLPNRKVRSAQARYSTGGKQKWEGRKVKSAQSSYTQQLSTQGVQNTQDRRTNINVKARNTRSKQQTTFQDFREDVPHRTPPAYEEVVDSSTSQLSNFFFKTELEDEEEEIGLDPYRLVGSTAECFPYKCATPGNQGWEQDKGRQQDELYITARKVPSGIQPLTPWLTEDIPPEWCGVDPRECLVFLPSLRTMDSPPPYIPPMQSPEDELPFTDILPPPQNSKRHQRVKEQRRHSEGHETPQFGAVQNVEIFSKSDGSLLHASNKKDKSMKEIRKEIDELDSILQGMEREETDNTAVPQQDSMENIKHLTNESSMRPPEPKTEGITHMRELEQYTDECEEVLASIRRQRQESLQELAQLHPALANRKLSL